MHKVSNNANPQKFGKNHVFQNWSPIMQGLQECTLTQNATEMYIVTIFRIAD